MRTPDPGDSQERVWGKEDFHLVEVDLVRNHAGKQQTQMHGPWQDAPVCTEAAGRNDCQATLSCLWKVIENGRGAWGPANSTLSNVGVKNLINPVLRKKKKLFPCFNAVYYLFFCTTVVLFFFFNFTNRKRWSCAAKFWDLGRCSFITRVLID